MQNSDRVWTRSEKDMWRNIDYYSSLLYSAILCSREDSLPTCGMWFWMNEWLYPFKYHFRLNLSDASAALKLTQGRRKCYESVKLNDASRGPKFERSTKTVTEKEPTWSCLPDPKTPQLSHLNNTGQTKENWREHEVFCACFLNNFFIGNGMQSWNIPNKTRSFTVTFKGHGLQSLASVVVVTTIMMMMMMVMNRPLNGHTTLGENGSRLTVWTWPRYAYCVFPNTRFSYWLSLAKDNFVWTKVNELTLALNKRLRIFQKMMVATLASTPPATSLA